MNILRKIQYTADAVKRLLIDCGLLRSIWSEASIDRAGQSIPWISHSAYEFINNMTLEGARVFEFGSGNSTLYWKERVESGELRSYRAVEYDSSYYQKMAAQDGFYRESVVNFREKRTYLDAPYLEATQWTRQEELFVPFDIMIVDGPIQWRKDELEVAHRMTCSEGIIILDDSNWLSSFVLDFCNKHSLCRVDFAGFSPGVSYRKVTSLLFRDIGWLYGAHLSTPVGGMRQFPGMA